MRNTSRFHESLQALHSMGRANAQDRRTADPQSETTGNNRQDVARETRLEPSSADWYGVLEWNAQRFLEAASTELAEAGSAWTVTKTSARTAHKSLTGGSAHRAIGPSETGGPSQRESNASRK